MALTWAGVITILFLAAACVRGYRRGLIKELVSLVCVFLSMAIVWFINPYVNEFIRENTSIYEKVQGKLPGVLRRGIQHMDRQWRKPD